MGMTNEKRKWEMDADRFEDFVRFQEARREMDVD